MLAHEDGREEGEEPLGHFFGRGAEKLGILGQEIGRADAALRDLFSGRDPKSGEVLRSVSLTERRYTVNGEERVHKPVLGYDFTFSAPKSVSILWATSPDDTRALIEACHRGAVAIALAKLEGDGFTTREKYQRPSTIDGETRMVTDYRHIPISPIFAVFSHETSRAVDPQLHDHAVLLNTGIKADGTGGALDGRELFKRQYDLGAIYRSELRRLLTEEVGLATHDKKITRGMSFEVTGVSPLLIEEFSKRSRAIDRAISSQEKVLGRPLTGGEAHAEALKSRAKKEWTSREELFKEWGKIAARHGFSPEKLLARNPSPPKDIVSLTKAVSKTLHYRTFEGKRGGFTVSDIDSAILYHAKGRISAADMERYREDFKARYTTPVLNNSNLYILSADGIRNAQEKDLYRTARRDGASLSYQVRHIAYQVRRTWRAIENASIKNRATFLYYTGRIDHRTYKRLTTDWTTKSRTEVEIAYATHGLSKAQRDYCIGRLDRAEKRFQEFGKKEREEEFARVEKETRIGTETLFLPAVSPDDKREHRQGRDR
jgi:conjugative relaxase-like TrwC/TraI family protein